MKIQLFLRFHTEFGQSLHVLGSIPALGSNQAEKRKPLEYYNAEFWTLTLDLGKKLPLEFNYTYFLKYADGHVVQDGEQRVFRLSELSADTLRVIDTWNHAGAIENVFYTDPFQKVLLPQASTTASKKGPKNSTHLIKVKAPLLQGTEVLCLLGNTSTLGKWNTEKPLLLSREEDYWTLALNLSEETSPVSYKYGIYDTQKKKFISYEEGTNRILNGDLASGITVLHDGFARFSAMHWRGAGVSIPVFSLRSQQSWGVGEFTDLRLLVDWAAKTGMKMIQILPVNDTTATYTWRDSYPYAAISAFALHPLYLNVTEVAGKKYQALLKPFQAWQQKINAKAEVQYEEVLKQKLTVLRELFGLQKDKFTGQKAFIDFFEKNRYWLVPYAAFCHLRDKYGTADFTRWKTHRTYSRSAIEKYGLPGSKHYEEITFHYFLQYHLHLQLKAAAEYAHQHGVILKGDIPIGVYRNGCDSWMEPNLFHRDMQAGAPPDDFAIHGQNWGFPTYNWEQMARDDFAWWRRRFAQMSEYFDAFRIDHILGFFRIWSIPITSTQGIMGHFVPCQPVHVNEFGMRGINFDHFRYAVPYISSAVLQELFGNRASELVPYLTELENGLYELKEHLSTQQQIEAWFAEQPNGPATDFLRQGLLDLAANVLLFEVEGSQGTYYHFRFFMQHTASYRHLDDLTKKKLYELYIDYFFRRQDEFWKQEALQKLPALKRSTNMLICGEDLGLVPGCVPDVMQQLGILSLEIQRMPKKLEQEFFHPKDAPYLSVVTPSTHDMSTIRGWWEEDRSRTQRFFNQQMGQAGEAPRQAEAWINKAILIQHLYSPAQWSVFQLQDVLGMSATLRNPDPSRERINIPADPMHNWNYRMHIPLEQLLSEQAFNTEWLSYVQASGRGS